MRIKFRLLTAITISCIVILSMWHINNNGKWTGEEAWTRQLEEKRIKKQNGLVKMDQPDKFQEFHNGIRTRESEKYPGYGPTYRLLELQKAKRSVFRNARVASTANGVLEYIERGPANVPGRTRGLLVLPGDPDKNTWLAGASGGGIWKTTDAGQSWINKSPDLPSLAVTSLAMSEVNTSIIYAGTGEYIASAGTAIEGDGIFKSEDGGETWFQLPSTAGSTDFISVTRIIVDPNDPNIILSCSAPNTWDQQFNSVIMKSTDGGNTWTQVFEVTSGGAIEQLIFEPNNFNIQYAAQNGVGVLKSVDGGDSWTLSNDGMSINGRVELAISPANVNKIYASTQGTISTTSSDLYVSSDAGITWSLVDVSFNSQPVNFLGGQGWYDNTIVCDPYDENIVYYGGVGLFRSLIGTNQIETGFYDLTNNTNFVEFVNFGAEAAGGIMALGPNANEMDIEIRFGTGINQLAHRFSIPSDGGSNGDGGAGVPASDYSYEDYISVPFEVWEVDESGNDIRQLMVSFRDQENDGVFNLNARDDANDPNLLTAREYIYVNDINYSTSPDSDISVAGGHEFNHAYFVWPLLAQGATWDPANLPDSDFKMFFRNVQAIEAETSPVVDPYNQFTGINNYGVNGVDVHPDQHNMVAIVMDETDQTYKILLSNDGGVFISNVSTTPGINEGDWTFAGSTYNTSQFYGADKMPGGDRYLGGMQDNGTWVSPSNETADASTNYEFSIGGDGFEVLWHSLDSNKLIGGSQNNGFARSLDGGSTWSQATSGLSGSFPFISKLANSKSFPDKIYAVSSDGVFVSENFGGNWELTSIVEKWGGASTFLDVEVSRANGSIVWAGSGMTDSRNLHVSTDGGKSFSTTNNYTDVTLGSISRLASHPTEDSTVYALFSFAKGPKVLRSQDLGENWEDISGFNTNTTSGNGFPDVAVYTLYVRPDNPNIIWVGSEIGIIESLDNGATWAILDEFPNASVWDLKGQDDQIVIATHGRGIWTAQLEQNQNDETNPASISKVGQSPQNELKVRVSITNDFDSLEVFINGQKLSVLNDAIIGDYTVTINTQATGLTELKTIGYINGAPYQSVDFQYDAISLNNPSQTYSTDFSGALSLTSTDFTTGLLGGDPSFQTEHNYVNNKEAISILKVPIIIDANYPLITYRDIALVEPINDFVAIEATMDGLNWEVLNKYDASLHSDWEEAYNQQQPGTVELFKEQNLDLTDNFNDGDLILIRFRLNANESENGWGWAIDDLYIQEEPTSTNSFINNLSSTLDVFPNPSNGKFTIRNGELTQNELSVDLYNTYGQLIKEYELGKNVNGNYEIVDYSLPKGHYILSIKSNQVQIDTKRVIIE